MHFYSGGWLPRAEIQTTGYKWEFYNIADDCSENNDLAAQNPGKLKVIRLVVQLGDGFDLGLLVLSHQLVRSEFDGQLVTVQNLKT